jgi:branched-chain amino acid transport system substrate-binding protein
MKLKKTTLIVSALALSFLAGCGNGSSTSGSTSGSTNTAKPSSAAANTVIKIASQSPLSGADAIPGESIKLGAQMSLDDHKAEFQKLGFDLQFVPYIMGD